MSTPAAEVEKAMASMQQLAKSPAAPSRTKGADRPARAKASKPRSGRQAPAKAKVRRNWLAILGWGTALTAAGMALPFVLLLRASMYGYQEHLLNPWLALGAGVLAATAGTLLYAFLATRLLGFRPRFGKGTARFMAALAVLYCGYATMYISAANVKTPAVQATYTDLHPLLRLAVGTLVLADGELVVTDGSRQPDDYAAMGLPVNRGSLHYAQTDGYVHAADLRTNGRAEWKNRVMALYFRALGFQTLRHVGTADHLHVSLPVPVAKATVQAETIPPATDH